MNKSSDNCKRGIRGIVSGERDGRRETTTLHFSLKKLVRPVKGQEEDRERRAK